MKLTDEQIEKAAQAFYESDGGSSWAQLSEINKDRYRRTVRTVAPFLQVPWDEPTTEELDLTWNEYANRRYAGTTWPDLLRTFVRRRNADLQSKPVDPRIEIVAQVFRNSSYRNYEDVAEAVLAALDSAK